MKISKTGIGFVGLSNAELLSQHHQVVGFDIIKEEVEIVNNRISPIIEAYIKVYTVDLFSRD